ncbi:nucleoporin NUP116/NSP116,putative [Plasmodium sp. gorilla clade G2]|uniref:nucleoporin NUP116/NSP116,putative n=1 Tax=Plasmodium sp. gorilla clade G2 TaxID=880535 RepID=UPI000D21EDE8|nr:nucleoporin NUP116/NSP116,putative [Plasmodium sp. gorilla clade G2]SOV19952.1 nucleoporin NUP116/NSP116,putative [Plasmodium sp. gorilla clade G2]
MERVVFKIMNENRIYANGCFLNIIAWNIPSEELDEIIKKYHFVFWKVYMDLYEKYRKEKIEDNIDTAIVCVVVKKYVKPHFIESVQFTKLDVSDLMGRVIPVYMNTNGKWKDLNIEEGNMVVIVNPHIYKTDEDSKNHAIDLQNSDNVINVATVAHVYKCVGRNSLPDKCPYLLHIPNTGFYCSRHLSCFSSRFNLHLEKEMTKHEENRLNNNYKTTHYLKLGDLKLGDLKLDDLKNDDLKNGDLKTDDLKTDDLKTEVLKLDDLNLDDLNLDDLKIDDLKIDDLKIEYLKIGDLNIDYMDRDDLDLDDLDLDDLDLDDIKGEDKKRDDNPRDDNQKDGNPRDGNPRDGNPRDGNPRDGNPRDGNPRDDNPRDDNPRDGNPRDGNQRDGNQRDGNTQECSNFFHRRFSNSERKDNLSKQNNFQNHNCNYIDVDVKSESDLFNNYNSTCTSRKFVDSKCEVDILCSLHSSKEELKESILPTSSETNVVQETFKRINNVRNKPNETDRAQNKSSGICRPDISSDRIDGISECLDMKKSIGESSSTKRRLSPSLFRNNENNKSSDNVNEVRKPSITRSRIEQSLDANKGIAQPKERKNEAKQTLYGNKEAKQTLYGNKEAKQTLYGNKEAKQTLYGNKEAKQTLYGNKEAKQTLYGNKEAKQTLYGNKEAKQTLYGNKEAKQTLYGNKEANQTLYGNKEAKQTLYGNKEAKQTLYGQRKLSHPSDIYNKQFQERSSKSHEMEQKRGTEKYDKACFRDSYIKTKTPSSHLTSYENRKGLYNTYVRTNENYEGTNKFINSNIYRETKTKEQIYPNNKEKINKNILDNQNITVGKKRPFGDMYDIKNTCEQKNAFFSESQKVYRTNNNIYQNNDKLVKHPSGKENNINPYTNNTLLECFTERDIEEHIKIRNKYSHTPVENEHILNRSKNEQNNERKKIKKPLHIILNEIEKAELYGVNELYKISINMNSIIKNFQHYIEDLDYKKVMQMCNRLSMHNFSYIRDIASILIRKMQETVDQKYTEFKFYSN